MVITLPRTRESGTKRLDEGVAASLRFTGGGSEETRNNKRAS